MSRGTKAVLAAAAGVIGGVLMVVAVLALASSGDVDVHLGDDEFSVGDVETFARRIAEDDGYPLIFPDLVGGERDIYVQHVGDRDRDGWFAFETRVPDTEDCLAEWVSDNQVFRSTCDEAVTFPPDGDGLRQYPTRVEDDQLVVDLRR